MDTATVMSHIGLYVSVLAMLFFVTQRDHVWMTGQNTVLSTFGSFGTFHLYFCRTHCLLSPHNLHTFKFLNQKIHYQLAWLLIPFLAGMATNQADQKAVQSITEPIRFGKTNFTLLWSKAKVISSSPSLWRSAIPECASSALYKWIQFNI